MNSVLHMMPTILSCLCEITQEAAAGRLDYQHCLCSGYTLVLLLDIDHGSILTVEGLMQ